ncbi:MAG: VWA domain-containing protein [Deltaproteobacteria bacterium]|nr:VWA domain-containing protein [Deltaproteobacteria bacterium]
MAAALLVVAGCGGGEADNGLSVDPGGGSNVGFGGAQDIGQFRDILDSGGIPAASTLDANGFFSEHYAELPPPDCGDPICLQAMFAVSRDWVRWEHQATLQLAMNTVLGPDDVEEKPLDIVVVVDTSGSMTHDGRIGKVRDGLHLLVDELGPDDRLGIVRYSDDAEQLAPLAAVDETTHDIVDGLGASGYTHLSAGMQLGFQTLQEGGVDPSRQARVILMSDGLANVGVTGDEELFAMAEGYIRDGIGLTTIGVGTDFNTELMRGLAERGSGNFYFLEDAAAVSEVFLEELSFFSVPIAHDIDIRVDGTETYRVGEVSGTHFWQSNGDSGAVQIPSVFVASRKSDEPGEYGRRGGGSALFIDLEPLFEGAEPSTAAVVTFSYRLPDGEEITRTITVDNPHAPGVIPEDDYYSKEFMREHYGMYNMYLGLRDASTAAEDNYQCAWAILDQLESGAGDWNAVMEDPDIEADLQLVAQFKANLVAGGATSLDKGYKFSEACGGFPGGPVNLGDDVEYGPYYGCSAGSTGGSGWPLLLVGLALVVVRRRRR